MRICIVTPSEEFAASAGVRIRYDRLALAAAELGHKISLQPIATFQVRGDFVHDVYIFAKTYTPHACVLALRMLQHGCRVGVDIFDDYFTQTADVRLLRFRQWAAEMVEIAQFFLCSTPRLAAAITPLLRGKPLGVIPDPSEIIDQQFLDQVLRRKAARMAVGEPMRIAWFGIGDNPYFPVGIRDLSAFGGLLQGFDGAHLRILTNARALTAAGLATLRRLPLPYSIEEWNPERERQELLAADLCFLPVNNQPFSKVKSLNRAITALSAGCQVLSAGFPLYQELGEFIYRSPRRLHDDLRTGACLLRAETLGAFMSMVTERANPFHGAAIMTSVIDRIAVPQVAAAALTDKFQLNVAVLHGSTPDGKLHKLVQRLDGFAVKGPTCQQNWNCHLRLDVAAGGRLRVFVGDNLRDQVAEAYRGNLQPHGKISDLDFLEIRLEGTPLAPLAKGWVLAENPSAIKQHAIAPRLSGDARTICDTLFPGVVFVSNDRLAAAAPRLRAST